MGLTNSQYQRIMRSYEQKQSLARDQLNEHYEIVYSKLPEYKALDESISTLSVRRARSLLSGDDQALCKLRSELEELEARKKSLLSSAGFPADYLDMHYQCEDCCDTGYIDNKKCHCFRQAEIQLLYEQSNLQDILNTENFDTFSFDYYSPNYIDQRTGRNSLSLIMDAVNSCREFVRTFSEHHPGLFLYGDVGTGKTFLSHCIAKEIMDQGHSVIYHSAPSLFRTLAESAFQHDNIEAHYQQELIYNCDLLIIDDLGTEYTNNFVTTQLFTCINERLMNGKSTIISTNLSLDTLADLYTERSFSRITSSYTLLKLVGDDIRIKKKLAHKEAHNVTSDRP